MLWEPFVKRRTSELPAPSTEWPSRSETERYIEHFRFHWTVTGKMVAQRRKRRKVTGSIEFPYQSPGRHTAARFLFSFFFGPKIEIVPSPRVPSNVREKNWTNENQIHSLTKDRPLQLNSFSIKKLLSWNKIVVHKFFFFCETSNRIEELYKDGRKSWAVIIIIFKNRRQIYTLRRLGDILSWIYLRIFRWIS